MAKGFGKRSLLVLASGTVIAVACGPILHGSAHVEAKVPVVVQCVDQIGRPMEGGKVAVDGLPQCDAPVGFRLSPGSHDFVISGRGESRSYTYKIGERATRFRLSPFSQDLEDRMWLSTSDRAQLAGHPAYGTLTPEVIDATIKKDLGAVRDCWQTHSPQNTGKLLVHFVISQDGTVPAAYTLSSTLLNDGTEGCIEEHFRQIRFPPPTGKGVVIVNYPILFH